MSRSRLHLPMAFSWMATFCPVPMEQPLSRCRLLTPGVVGSWAGRGGQLGDAAIFYNAGFNVLTLNSRVCSSLGWFSLGYYEIEDVLAARDYLLTRPDIDPGRISLHGFSSGGATALMAAQRSSGFRSVSAMGGYHDYAVELGLGQPADFFSVLYQWGIAGGYRLFTGNDITFLLARTMNCITSLEFRCC